MIARGSPGIQPAPGTIGTNPPEALTIATRCRSDQSDRLSIFRRRDRGRRADRARIDRAVAGDVGRAVARGEQVEVREEVARRQLTIAIGAAGAAELAQSGEWVAPGPPPLPAPSFRWIRCAARPRRADDVRPAVGVHVLNQGRFQNPP